MMGNRMGRLIGYGVLCAFIAFVLCFASSYALTRFNVGFFAASEEMPGELEILNKAALNIYAIQHVKLIGSGTVEDMTGTMQEINASILLPYSVWSFIPFIAFFIALFVMQKTNREMETRHGFFSAVTVAVFYALISLVGAFFIQAHLDTVPIPEINGLDVVPPLVPFQAQLLSAFINTLLLGVICAAVRSVYRYKYFKKNVQVGNWLPCASSVLAVNIVIAIVLSVGAWLGSQRLEQDSYTGYVELIPMAVSKGYLSLFGSSVSARAFSEMSMDGRSMSFIDVDANIYKNIAVKELGDIKESKISFNIKLVAALIVFVLGFTAGWIAVKKKSRDGSLATAGRVLVFQILVLAALLTISNLQLLSNSKMEDYSTKLTVLINSSLSWPMLPVLLIFAFGSIFGAQMSHSAMKASRDI